MPERRCAAGCDPLAWLASLLAGGAQDTPKAARSMARAAAAGPGAVRPATAGADSDGEAAPVADPSTAQAAPDTSVETADAAHTAHLPVPEDPSAETPRRNSPSDPAGGDAGDGVLRTGEVIGRVWIAPFVDAGGLYREGSWVRVVIAPAKWRVR